jgi:plastocyanin
MAVVNRRGGAQDAVVMIRRAGLAAFALLVLSTASVSAATKTVNMADGNVYQPKVLKIAVGTAVQWHNADNAYHTSTANGGPGKLALWDFQGGPGTTFSPYTFSTAGTYPYHCEIYASMTGKVKVKMSSSPATGPAGTYFTITFGTGTVNTSYTRDVQLRKAGGTFSLLVSTRNPTTVFHALTAGTWEFRARLRYVSDDRVVGWSPILKVVVS